MRGYLLGISQVCHYSATNTNLWSRDEIPNPLQYFFSRSIIMCTQSRCLLLTYNMLRRQLHTSQIQWACLEGFGQTLGEASNAVGANVGTQGSSTISPLEGKCHGPSLCCLVAMLPCWAFKFLFQYPPLSGQFHILESSSQKPT